jgi:GNAT superfamily N-acetyltransferase
MIITTRRASPGDLAEVQRLNQALFRYEHDSGFYLGELYNQDWPYHPDGISYFTDCLGNNPANVIFLAELNHVPIGYLAASYATKSFWRENPVAEIDNMYIEDDYRGQGAGSELIALFKDWARTNGVARIRVGALAANSKAINFYHRNGFENDEVVLGQLLTGPSR